MKRAAFLFVLLAAPVAVAGPISIRVGLGLDHTSGTTLLDEDCSSTNPPALFGCVDGADGMRLGARGDFGVAPAFELGVGWDVTPQARIDATLARRGLDFEADANFLGVEGQQPVAAGARSMSALVTGTWLFGASVDARPFVMAGAGMAWNETDPIAFAFPGIAPDAVTVVRGGTKTGFAYTAGAGVVYALSERIEVELALRYTSLGDIGSEAGAATIVRPRGTTVIDIAATEAQLETVGVMVSMRWRPCP